jgi:nucleoside-diphosphate-sugar epimerase
MVAARLGIVHGLGPVMKDAPVFLAVPQRFCQQAAAGERLRASTGPHSVLPFVHIADAVEGLIRCMDLPRGVHIANVAAEARSVADVARVVQDAGHARGLRVEVEYGGPLRPYAERRISSLLADYGFSATRTLEGSLPEVLDYYLASSTAGAGAGSRDSNAGPPP